jgi:uncharacterized protein YdhG (YjbR/CyaY superfamily)
VRGGEKEVPIMNKRKQPKTIDEYISLYPKNVQIIQERIRKAIRLTAPGAEETISYQIPTFRLKGNLVHFAAYKNHIGFYPTSSAIESFKGELSSFETSRGTIRFPMDKPIPIDLVKRIVKYRVKQINKKA